MIQNQKMQFGASDKVFLTKRMECSVLIFAAFYIMVVSIVFSWFYQSKFDAANIDAYDLLDDALAIDGMGLVDDEVYMKSHLTFYANDARCTVFNYSVRIKPGLVFNQAFDRAFLVRRVRRNNIIRYYQCLVSQQNQSLNITAHFDEEPRFYTQIFSFLNSYSQYDPESGSSLNKYISAVQLRFYSFKMDQDIIDGFSHEISIDYSESQVANYYVYIHCANELLPYDIPSLSQVLIMAISFVLFLLGGLALLFFLWHCWSYKYVLIKKAIIESGLVFER